VSAASLSALVAAGADVLGGFGVDQGLQDQPQRLADDVEVAAGAECIQQVGQGCETRGR
jgi:hypothetical protein